MKSSLPVTTSSMSQALRAVIKRRHYPLEAPRGPRVEVVDELLDAVVGGHAPLHDGRWARSTLEVCLALLRSAQQGEAVTLGELRSCNMDSSDV